MSVTGSTTLSWGFLVSFVWGEFSVLFFVVSIGQTLYQRYRKRLSWLFSVAAGTVTVVGAWLATVFFVWLHAWLPLYHVPSWAMLPYMLVPIAPVAFAVSWLCGALSRTYGRPDAVQPTAGVAP